MGHSYVAGFGTRVDYAKAYYYFTLAAKYSDNPESIVDALYTGLASGQFLLDAPDALTKLDALAKEGSAYAYEKLGEVNLYGYGGTRDFGSAAHYFAKAAKSRTSAKLKLATMLRKGTGIIKNPEGALYLYLQLAEAGEVQGQREAGLMLLRGKGVQKDREKGKMLLAMAADQGDVTARRALKPWWAIGN